MSDNRYYVKSHLTWREFAALGKLLLPEPRRAQGWIASFVLLVCVVSASQTQDLDNNQRILRALRTFNKAQVLYQVYGRGFACRLEQLAPPPNGRKPSPEAAGLIDAELASGEFAGYHIGLNCTSDDYQVIAVPASSRPGAVWCVDKSTVLRTADTPNECIGQGRVVPVPKRIKPDEFSKTAPSVSQETRAHGYWVDPANGLMWAAKDSGKRGSWRKAMKYCRKLRLAGYKDWRLATIDELESLVNLPAYATEYEGSSDILHWNSELQVSGGLLLTYARQWSSTPVVEANGRPSGAKFWSFWFDKGIRWEGFEDWAEGDTMNALCVRDAVVRASK